MNLTLSIDEAILREARKAAESMGISLNEAVRRYLVELAGRASAEEDLAELLDPSRRAEGHSRGRRFNRDELHERT